VVHAELLGQQQSVPPIRALGPPSATQLLCPRGMLSLDQQGLWLADEMLRAVPGHPLRPAHVRFQSAGGLDIIRVPHHGAARSRTHSLGSLADVEQSDIVSRVRALHDLLQREEITAARKMLDLIPLSALEDPAINRLRRALAPPTARSSQRKDGERTQTFAWLRQHAREYRGQWVAVGEDGLIAAAPTLKELRERLRSLAVPAEQSLIHKL
jgi:hypothetical protein